MNGETRRELLLSLLSGAEPLSGGLLAEKLQVSRQVVVQDIALLRARGSSILSTSRGYLLRQEEVCSRVFKVKHTTEETLAEMDLIVDNGGIIEDVFVYHHVYGIVRGSLHIRSRRDARQLVQELAQSPSKELMNITGGYHYHTVRADSRQTLDLIQEELRAAGFLAPLRDYEPVNFSRQGEEKTQQTEEHQ